MYFFYVVFIFSCILSRVYLDFICIQFSIFVPYLLPILVHMLMQDIFVFVYGIYKLIVVVFFLSEESVVINYF